MDQKKTTPSIFVFGSNLAGRHGKGAALTAKQQHGAVPGQGAGRMGQSYGVPTKDRQLQPLPLAEIDLHVQDFVRYASDYPGLRFFVTALGTGLAGYSHEQMAPLFADAPENCELPKEWLAILRDRYGLP